MNKPAALSVVVATGALAALALAGCTLLLPTNTLITACTVQNDCDEALGAGFICEDNACLPEDEDNGSG